MDSELFFTLIEHVTSGGSIDHWLLNRGVSASSLKSYLENTPGARKRLDSSITFRSEYLFETLITAANNCDSIEKADVPAHKLKIDTLRWVLSVQDPEKFTSKINTATTASGEVIMIDTGIRRDSDESEPEGDN